MNFISCFIANFSELSKFDSRNMYEFYILNKNYDDTKGKKSHKERWGVFASCFNTASWATSDSWLGLVCNNCRLKIQLINFSPTGENLPVFVFWYHLRELLFHMVCIQGNTSTHTYVHTWSQRDENFNRCIHYHEIWQKFLQKRNSKSNNK